MALCDRLEAAQVERERRRDTAVGAICRDFTEVPAIRHRLNRALTNILPAIRTPHHINELRQTILSVAGRGGLFSTGEYWHLGAGVPSRRPSETDHPPFAIPSSWQWLNIGELLAEETRNGYSRKPDDASDGIRILKISAGTKRPDAVVAEEEYKLISGVSEVDRDQLRLCSGDSGGLPVQRKSSICRSPCDLHRLRACTTSIPTS